MRFIYKLVIFVCILKRGKMSSGKKTISTGKLLDAHLKNNQIQGERLANLIGVQGQTVSKYRSGSIMKSSTIEQICYALEHNFFQDMANHLPREFSVNATLNSANQELIAQLQEENKVLKIQNELLMRMKG